MRKNYLAVFGLVFLSLLVVRNNAHAQFPTPTPTMSPDDYDSCNLTSPISVACDTARPSVDIETTTDIREGEYTWTSNCPGEIFSGSDPLKKTLAFDAYDKNGVPNSCTVVLNIRKEWYGEGEDLYQCSTQINVGPCKFDCAKTLNGTKTYDRCGVCDGNGQSCISCADSSNKANQLAVDGMANRQKAVAITAARTALKSQKNNAAAIAKINDLMNQVQSTYISQWSSIWLSLPSVIRSCTSSSPCLSVSFVGEISSYNTRADQLHTLTRNIISYIVPQGRFVGLRKLYSARAIKALQNAHDGVNKLPASTSTCS